MKPHLMFFDGQWHVGLRGNRRYGWRFGSFERACEFAFVISLPDPDSAPMLRKTGWL